MTKLSDEILALRSEGKTYNEIVTALGCSKSTVSYHCGEGQKVKTRQRLQSRRKESYGPGRRVEAFQQTVTPGVAKNHGLTPKRSLRQRVDRFQERKAGIPNRFNRIEAEEKFMENGKICYLSGREIDLQDPSSYELDHIVPRSKNGDNSIENLGFACVQANQSKSMMTVDEYLLLCKDVLEHNGYEVIDPS